MTEIEYQEKLKLYEKYKDAYYKGNPLVSDIEFDELEDELGLTNKSDVGTKESADVSYTEKHSCPMGSLDKVKVKIDDATGEMNFDEVVEEINKKIQKSNNANYIEISPKMDGCSFSLETTIDDTGSFRILSCSTRGDGYYGQDNLPWFMNCGCYETHFNKLEEATKNLTNEEYDIFSIRGEILITHDDFKNDIQGNFRYTNSRATVSGIINRKWDSKDKEFETTKLLTKYLHYVCYDYRLVNSKNGEFVELSWMNPHDATYSLLSPYIDGLGELPDKEYCKVIPIKGNVLNVSDFAKLYDDYHKYRYDICQYPLDGIVFKPECSARSGFGDTQRIVPVDSIAVKYVAEKQKTRITKIDWTISKNGECIPTAETEPVYMDGKKVSHAQTYNYNWMIENKCGIGSEVTIALNGDIIPGIIEVLSEGNIELPSFETYIKETAPTKEGEQPFLHLMKKFTLEEWDEHKFVSSCNALEIKGLAEKMAKKIWQQLYPRFLSYTGERLWNVVQLMKSPGREYFISEMCGTKKSFQNILDAMDGYHSKMTLGQLIQALCIEGCGERTSTECARMLSGISYDTTGLNEDAYKWALDVNDSNYILITNWQKDLNLPMLVETENDENLIPVILTGSPEACTSHKNKKAWLSAHPQYVETTKWSEAKILFTNDLQSKSSKMSKAQKNGVEIKQYYE